MSKTNPFLGMSAKELLGMIAEERAKLRDMALKISVGQLRAVRTVREAKKRIARMETQLSVLKTS
ncbi:MAG: 50S ribosomal protein L29 [Patescibacteria group bacterium]|jgi:ribosomal protein L29